MLLTGKHWHKHAAPLTLALGGNVIPFFFILFFKSIELFCLSFHFRLGKTRRLVCIQLINLDLSLEGEGLICYVLKTPFDFPFFFRLGGWEKCLFCLNSLPDSKRHAEPLPKSARRPFTLVTRRDIDHSNIGVSSASWDLVSASRKVFFFADFGAEYQTV